MSLVHCISPTFHKNLSVSSTVKLKYVKCQDPTEYIVANQVAHDFKNITNKFNLRQATKVLRGSRGIVLLCL
jgi:hypothetical protein